MSTRTDQIHALVGQLAACERGRQALADLRALLKNGGCGLDQNNARALKSLFDLAITGGVSGSVLDALYPYRQPQDL
jgi:hypothetical protein